MSIRVVTWNTQGNPLANPRKTAHLDELLRRNHFVLLQECGVLAQQNTYRSGAGITYRVHGRIPPGAGNNRCSTAILYRYRIGDRVVPDFYQGTRFGIAIQRGALYVGTMHGTSGGVGLVDLRPFCNYLAGPIIRRQKFIVGADFNADPGRLAGRHGRIPGHTGSRTSRYRISATVLPTHPRSRSRLDYFVSNLVCRVGARRSLIAVSDHHSVSAVFWEQFDPTLG